MNCIGPCAPAALALRSFPNFVSTKFTAASTFHGILNLR
jgi:hypothetical protein